MDNKKVMEGEYWLEKEIGLKFPNWISCPYYNICPKEVRKKREASLIKHYCSNNESILECDMFLELEYFQKLYKL